MEDLTLISYLILFFAGIAAGLLDSIAGGGGMIAVPALLSVGLPPHLAVGTNKIQGTIGCFTSAFTYVKGGLVDFKEVRLGIFFSLIGGVLGAFIVRSISPDNLREIIPVLLTAIFVYIFSRKKVGEEDRHAILKPTLFYPTVGFAIGTYDGFFGPGTGAFWTIGFVALLGFNLKKATGFTKVVNSTSGIAATVAFIYLDLIVYSAALAMAVGQIIGARSGAKLVLRKGVGFIRYFFLFAVGATIIKLAYDTYFTG